MSDLIAHLITLLLSSLALQGQPTCAPDPVVTFIQPQGGMAVCQLAEWPEYRCQAEGGKLIVRVWTATADGAVYEVQVRERVFGLSRTFWGQRVYRNGARLYGVPLYETFDGEKMPRVRPSSCDLPSITLTDA